METPFWTRLLNFYNEFYEWAFIDHLVDQSMEEIVKGTFGPDFPNSKELARNTSLFFVNSNPFFEFPRPISNKIIYIGGLGEENNKQVKLDTVRRWKIEAFEIIIIHNNSEKSTHFG
jgi:hypothetical protein